MMRARVGVGKAFTAIPLTTAPVVASVALRYISNLNAASDWIFGYAAVKS